MGVKVHGIIIVGPRSNELQWSDYTSFNVLDRVYCPMIAFINLKSTINHFVCLYHCRDVIKASPVETGCSNTLRHIRMQDSFAVHIRTVIEFSFINRISGTTLKYTLKITNSFVLF